MSKPIRVAACHAAPIFLSASRTTQKALSLIYTAARNHANLIVFPETFIPAFPLWSALRPPTQNHALFHRMAAQSVHADGPCLRAIQSAARDTKTYISMGFSERAHYSAGTLFNANATVGPDGRVLNLHRKLTPTFFEKLTWAPGDGHGLRVVDTEWGKLGALICGENTNPLARYSLMAQGEQLHISTWPAVWPTRVEGPGKAARGERDGRNYDNVAANRMRAAAHCFEAKAFGVMCAGFLDEMGIAAISEGAGDEMGVRRALENAQRGATMFLDPTGAPVKAFTVDGASGERREMDCLQDEEGILYADLDLGACVEGKQFHDVVGGYQRHDIFELRVNRTRQRPVHFSDLAAEGKEESR